MASNPASEFTDAKPVATDTGPDVVGDTQTNLQALRDALIIGNRQDWDVVRTFDVTNTEEVDDETYDKGTERLRATYTWETSGGDRRVQSILYEYSSTSGVDYVTISTWTPTYSGASDHRVTSEAST
jgi:hypothetical protein